ncbi:MAG: DNA alkylation repair protein [Marinifilaceae bacterium]
MEFFLDNQEIESQYQEILKEINLLMNGEIHQEMKDYGLQYEKSLGASIISLRQLASKYDMNHLLAQKLWCKAYRETRILATLLEEPEKVTGEQIDRWMGELESPEMIEQISMNLFCKIPGIMETVVNWIGFPEEKFRWAALLITGRRAMLGMDVQEEVFSDFLSKLPLEIFPGYYQKTLCRNLGKIARKSERLRKQIIALLQERRNNDSAWMEVAQEMKYELDAAL